MLQAEKILYRYYQHSPLLENLDCTVQPGEIVGLPGPSGCGKSTFGHLLAGYHTPQAGTVTCFGHALPKAGYCPVQMIFQHPELAVNPRWKIGAILAEGNSDCEELLYQFGMSSSWLDRYPHELSGGNFSGLPSSGQ